MEVTETLGAQNSDWHKNRSSIRSLVGVGPQEQNFTVTAQLPSRPISQNSPELLKPNLPCNFHVAFFQQHKKNVRYMLHENNLNFISALSCNDGNAHLA